jgi:hypothetical protein
MNGPYILSPAERETALTALIRARHLTPNLARLEADAYDELADRLRGEIDPHREPGDIADDACGDHYLSQARTLA